MKFHPSNFIQLTLATIVLILSFSCNKDSDLLAEYVVEQPQAFMVNDVVVTLANNPVVIKPLSNDTFEKPEEVTITEVTPPKMGTAEVQEDNTVVYTPNPDETGTDEFDYKTTITNPDNSVSTETGSITVTVTPTDKTPADPNAVNFSKYGAVGDGKTDDTKALRSALASETNLIATAGAVFKISGKIDIVQSGDQTVDWNGATITTSTAELQAFKVDKPSGVLNMKDLLIDGNDNMAVGIWMVTRVNFTNVDITRIKSNTQTAYAFRYEVISESPNGWGDSSFDDCDCYDINSNGNNVIGDVVGTTRCLIFRWWHSGSTSTVTWSNSRFEGVWGDDGDLIQHEQRVSNINGSRLIFDSMLLKDFSRRGVKGTGGGIEFRNSTFVSPSADNPKLTSSVPSSGLVAMGNFINSEQATGTKFINCIIDNTLGYDGRLIINRQEGLEITGCTFINSRIGFTTTLIGNTYICKNTFDSNSDIYEYNLDANLSYTGKVSIGNNNIGLEGKNKLPSSRYTMVNCADN